MFVFAREATRLPETPKSQSLTSPTVLTKMFVGLTSIKGYYCKNKSDEILPRWMMLRLSLRYLRPRTVQEVIHAKIFSSRIPRPLGTNFSKLPPSIYHYLPHYHKILHIPCR